MEIQSSGTDDLYALPAKYGNGKILRLDPFGTVLPSPFGTVLPFNETNFLSELRRGDSTPDSSAPRLHEASEQTSQ